MTSTSTYSPHPLLSCRRSYEDYIAHAEVAKEQVRRRTAHDATPDDKKLPDHYKGVRGVWNFVILPYGHLIHLTMDMMHTLNNVIRDTLDSLRPSHAGDPGRYYAHVNRTYKRAVVEACEGEGIFQKQFRELKNNKLPPWVLPKAECLQIDRGMQRVLGAWKCDEVARFIMRSGGAQKSHDTIQWAETFAQRSLGNKNTYTDNLLNIYNIMGILNASRLHVPTVTTDVRDNLLKALTTRSGLVPLSECTVTLHEMMHLIDQVQEVGSCRHSTLFKFEKMNKVMKGCVKNTAKGCKAVVVVTAFDCF